MRHKWDRATVQEISDKAEACFWAEVARQLPGVPGGVDPFESRRFSDSCFSAVDEFTQNAGTPLEKLADLINTGERITRGEPLPAPSNPDVPGLNFRQRVGARLEAARDEAAPRNAAEFGTDPSWYGRG